MKACIFLLLLWSLLNAMEQHAELSRSDEHLSVKDPASISPSDLSEGDGDDIIDILPSSPAPLLRMGSSTLNRGAEAEYHETNPALFYQGESSILTAKIKNFGKILRCGTRVDIKRIEDLLIQMPAILRKVQKNFETILRHVDPSSHEHIMLNAYKEFAISIAVKISSSEPLSVSELLAVFGNINASIIEAQNIVSQVMKKRLDDLSQEVQKNKGMQFIANGVSNKFEEKLSNPIKRINNAIKLLDEFSNAQKDILSFSNLLQDFFLQARSQQGKEVCSTEALFSALNGDV